MKTHRARLNLTAATLALVAGALNLAVASCGDRTGLYAFVVDGEADASDTGSPHVDSGEDSDDGGGPFDDAGQDAGDADAMLEAEDDAGDADADAMLEAEDDANDGDAPMPDAIAPFDVNVPPDSGLRCADGGVPTAYLFDQNGSLYTFSPTTLQATFAGTPSCTEAADFIPWTLSVSEDGTAYLLFEDWHIYAVDLTTFECHQTPFQAGQLGIDDSFAIAISRATTPERLYIYGDPEDSGPPLLASTDLTSFVLTEVGPALPTPPFESSFDMQADLFGHLFVYTPDSVLTELDATTGAVLGSNTTGFPTSLGDSWAVMTYESDVYLFADAQVAHYNFATGHADLLGTVTGIDDVVGASAVPCYAGP